MNINQINVLIERLNASLKLLDGLKRSDEEFTEFDEAMYQIERVSDALTAVKNSYGDIIYFLDNIGKEYQFIKDEMKKVYGALNDIGVGLSEKTENPYKQVEFISFKGDSPNAYT